MKMGRTEKVSYCQILKYLPQEQRNCTLIYQEKCVPMNTFWVMDACYTAKTVHAVKILRIGSALELNSR